MPGITLPGKSGFTVRDSQGNVLGKATTDNTGEEFRYKSTDGLDRLSYEKVDSYYRDLEDEYPDEKVIFEVSSTGEPPTYSWTRTVYNEAEQGYEEESGTMTKDFP